jgi:hypothetical protein
MGEAVASIYAEVLRANDLHLQPSSKQLTIMPAAP